MGFNATKMKNKMLTPRGIAGTALLTTLVAGIQNRNKILDYLGQGQENSLHDLKTIAEKNPSRIDWKFLGPALAALGVGAAGYGAYRGLSKEKTKNTRKNKR